MKINKFCPYCGQPTDNGICTHCQKGAQATYQFQPNSVNQGNLSDAEEDDEKTVLLNRNPIPANPSGINQVNNSGITAANNGVNMSGLNQRNMAGTMPLVNNSNMARVTPMPNNNGMPGAMPPVNNGNMTRVNLMPNNNGMSGAMPYANMGNVQASNGNANSDAKKNGKNKIILIIIIVVLLLGITSAVAIIALKTDVFQNMKQTDKSEEISKEETQTNSDKDEKTGEDIAISEEELDDLNEFKNEVETLEDISNADEIFNGINEIYSTYPDNEDVQNIVNESFDIYYGKVVEYIDMIKSIEDFNIAHYQECQLRYDNLKKWNESLNCGYDEELQNDSELCKKEYKNKYVKRFDDECLRTMEENGVISRTVAWGILEGIENTDLYDMSNINDEDYKYDSLRLRYIVAKVYKIHKDIVSMDYDSAISTIKDAMVECDYDPMLVYLLDINGYEPAQDWMDEIENILSSYNTDDILYRSMDDSTRLNYVYLYNVELQDYKACKEQIVKYMEENYK